jgi:hypothetical protein
LPQSIVEKQVLGYNTIAPSVVPIYTGGNSGGIRSGSPVFAEDRRGLLTC